MMRLAAGGAVAATEAQRMISEKVVANAQAQFAAGAWFVGSSGAIAGPANGAAIDEAANDVGIAESVHCRPFRHWHRWGYGTGCGRGVVIREGSPSLWRAVPGCERARAHWRP